MLSYPARHCDGDGGLQRHVHADRGGGHERRVRFRAAVFIWRGMKLSDVPGITKWAAQN